MGWAPTLPVKSASRPFRRGPNLRKNTPKRPAPPARGRLETSVQLGRKMTPGNKGWLRRETMAERRRGRASPGRRDAPRRRTRVAPQTPNSGLLEFPLSQVSLGFEDGGAADGSTLFEGPECLLFTQLAQHESLPKKALTQIPWFESRVGLRCSLYHSPIGIL